MDQRRRAGLRTGQFLVLGSASLELLRQSSESLAGRITFVELTPIRIDELAANRDAIEQLWVRGGFPDSLLASGDASSMQWRQAFIRTYLERDIPQFGPRVLRRRSGDSLTMLAHGQAQQMNAARLASGLGVSGSNGCSVSRPSRDLLLVRRLRYGPEMSASAWSSHRRCTSETAGSCTPCWEWRAWRTCWAIPWPFPPGEAGVGERLCGAGGLPVSYYRTSSGAEIDVVIEGRRGRRYAVEIKRSSAPGVSAVFGTAWRI